MPTSGVGAILTGLSVLSLLGVFVMAAGSSPNTTFNSKGGTLLYPGLLDRNTVFPL